MQDQSRWRAPEVECRMVSTAWLSGGPDRGTNSKPRMLPDKRSIQEPALKRDMLREHSCHRNA